MNYRKQGGDNTVIDGTLTINGTLAIAEGATFTGFPQAAKVSEAAGSAPTAAEFKALLDALKAAGLMASS